MHRIAACLALILSFSLCLTAQEDSFKPPKIQVPEGFEVQVAAAPPLVKHPLME